MEQAQIDEMMDTEAGRELARQHQANKLAERQAIADQIGTVRKQRGIEVTPLSEAEKKALATVEAAEKSLQDAKEKHRLAQAKHQKAKAASDARISSLERELVQTAPDEIDAFIQSLRDEVEEIRQNGPTTRSEPTGRTFVDSGRPVMRHFSNSRSVDCRMRAIREAISTAEGFKRQVLGDLDDRLMQLRDDLPELVMEQLG